jgi:hypothetical protein
MTKYLRAYREDIKSADDPYRIPFVAGTSNQVRDKDVVELGGMDLAQYKRNPAIDYAHGSTRVPPAHAEDIRIDEGLIRATAVFDKLPDTPGEEDLFAETVRRAYHSRRLNAFSISWIPHETANLDPENPWGGTRHIRSELLGIAIVPIPSDPDALVAGRSMPVDNEDLADILVRLIERHGTQAVLQAMPHELRDAATAHELAQVLASIT